MKSYSDTEKQVNRILVNYLFDEYSQPINETAQQRIYKVRDGSDIKWITPKTKSDEI